MQVEVVSANAPLSTGLQTYTSSELGSLVPKAAYFILSGTDFFDDSDPHAQFSVGAADGTRQWVCAGRSSDAQGTSNSETRNSTAACILMLRDFGGSPDGFAIFDAFVAGGVRVNWTNVGVDDFKFVVVLFAGDDLSAHVGTFTLGAQDVEVDITAPGFRPKTILGVYGHGTINDTAADQWISFGAAVDSGSSYTQKSWTSIDIDGVGTSDVQSFSRTNRIGDGDGFSIEFDNPDSSGFSAFARGGSPSGSKEMFYLALGGFSNGAFVEDYSLPTSTGNDAVTGVGFQPEAVLVGVTTCQTQDTLISNTDANIHGFGCFTPDDEFSVSVQNRDGLGTTDTNSLCADRALVTHQIGTPAGPFTPDATFVSMDVDGFTLNFSTVNGATRFGWFVAFGPEEDDFPTHMALLGVGV